VLPSLFLVASLLAVEPPDTEVVSVGGGTIEVTIGPALPTVPREALLAWVETCAKSVAAYFGRFPVARVRLSIVTGGRGDVGNGRTWGGSLPRIRIGVGQRATQHDLDADWVLTHEMIHLSLPDLPDGYSWMEEGLAVYVESVARRRDGRIDDAEMWGGLVRGMPQGQAGPRDGGLVGDDSWGRTYWGGAIFWLAADVEIREKTGRRKGLEDAMKGVLAAGGSIREDWTADRVIGVADRAVGLTVLHDLLDRLGMRAGRVDLGAMWKRLGVSFEDGSVRFDDHAPLAAVRRAISTGN
jgi:hypothetical protein